MNCTEYQDQFAALAEHALCEPEARKVADHLQSCHTCRTAFEEQMRLRDHLMSKGTSFNTVSWETRVMDRILQEQSKSMRRIEMRKQHGKARLGLIAIAAAVALAVILPLTSQHGNVASAAEVLNQGIAALANLHSAYIKLKVRTLPRDNFELIGLNDDFVEHEMWKVFGEQPQWRVEKPGRVVVMDGDSSLLLIQPNYAAKGDANSGFVGWLQRLMDVDQVLDTERQLAAQNGWDLQLAHATGADGKDKLIVTVEAAAQGDFMNDWCRDKSITTSDNRRVYRFDAETKLLEELQVYVHTDDGEVLVMETVEIAYNRDIDPSLFVLELPQDVIWLEQPTVIADNEAYAELTPDEAARKFFQACADEDWDEILKFWTTSAVDPQIKDYLGGIEIINIGEPFQSGQYPGWFVPYEIKLKSGQVKQHNLAVRNDNPAKRYVVDGGI